METNPENCKEKENSGKKQIQSSVKINYNWEESLLSSGEFI